MGLNRALLSGQERCERCERSVRDMMGYGQRALARKDPVTARYHWERGLRLLEAYPDSAVAGQLRELLAKLNGGAR